MQHWGIYLDRKYRCLLDCEARNKILSGVLAWSLTASLATALMLAWSLVGAGGGGANCLAITGNSELPVPALRKGADRVASESDNAV